MVTAVKEEKWELNLGVSGLLSTDHEITSRGVGVTRESMITFQEYPVPVGVSLVFTTEDTISLYYVDDRGTTSEINAQQLIEVVVSDAAKQNTRNILNPTRYGNLKEFEDADKLCHLDIAAGEQVIVREGERVCIRGNCLDLTIDASESYFRLTCKRIRHTLFE